MTALLWTLVALGGWNLLNALARAYEGRPQPYLWSIVLGLWAAYLLAMAGAC